MRVSSVWGLDGVLTSPHSANLQCYEEFHDGLGYGLIIWYDSSVLLTKYYSSDEIKTNDMGGAFGAYGRKRRCIQGFCGET
jgi:hypothetical protein